VNIPLFKKSKSSCCPSAPLLGADKKILLVGTPNVGKSVLFHNLTGIYTTVSNYPGTTVEIDVGRVKIGETDYEVIDTPGMYSLSPLTEEERISQSLLIDTEAHVVVHVVDARNLKRMLPLTLQLIEAELPVLLVVNLLDEAKASGVEVDFEELRCQLGIPVVGTVMTLGRGMKELIGEIQKYAKKTSRVKIQYPERIEEAISRIEALLEGEYRISRRSLALLLLQEDAGAFERISKEKNHTEIKKIVEEVKSSYADPLTFTITLARQRVADEIEGLTVHQRAEVKPTLQERLDRLTIQPVTGLPILFIILYFTLYRFVGVFGAGTLVDFLENTVFAGKINPWLVESFTQHVPYPLLQDLFVGEYGILTQALTYAVAIVLPIVGTFFIAFSIIEDSGYLPRLALLIDRVFKKIGLSGRAVIPMTLGFGCDTMATIVTRTLETKRERVIASLLLALAIPCSAQLGVILGILSNNPRALILWAVAILFEFLFIGYLAAKILPGAQPSFFMEIPPLRIPKLANVLSKTYTRMQWYFFEVMPLFVLASVLIWIGKIAGIFQLTLRLLEYPVTIMGLPREAAFMFLFGFFRRDYGAAGMYDLYNSGILSGNNLVVAAVTLTLFVPCIAQFMVMVKERGLKTALAIAGFITPAAFTAGYLLHVLLTISGVNL
jgi:ferrous iron transport protein B